MSVNETDGIACKTCLLIKSRNDFLKHLKTGDRLHPNCKSCRSLANKLRYLSPNHGKIQNKQDYSIISENDGIHYKICSICKSNKTLASFYVKQNVTMSWCKTCANKSRNNFRQTSNGKFSEYKAEAKYMKRGWSLSISEFMEHWQVPCHYCGIEIKTCGLDRIDSSTGYHKHNVVSSCYECNYSKMDKSPSCFLSQTNLLYNNIEHIKNIKLIGYPINISDCFICGLPHSDHQIKCVKNRSPIPLPDDPISREVELAKRISIRRLRPRHKYSMYKSGAKKRCLKFDISKEQFFSMWKKPCSYCLGSIEMIGVDRVNNDIGYHIGNVTPCCETCNRMKMDRSLPEFIEWIERIGKYQESLKNNKQ